MSWSELLRFIDARDPGFRSTVEGVPAESIALCQHELGITLPRIYVDFLLIMGANAGTFRPFGASQNPDFYGLIEAMSDDEYPTDRYFRVSIETDTSEIEYYEYYLDLARSNRDDGALVEFERGLLFPDLEDCVIDAGLTCAEQFTRQIFNAFEVRRRSYSTTLALPASPVDDAALQIGAATHVLVKMGLTPALPPTEKIICLGRGALCVLLEHHASTQRSTLVLAGDERGAVALAAEQFLDACPGAQTSVPMVG